MSQEQEPTTEARSHGEVHPILKAFDEMAIELHDADGHTVRNISVCQEKVCRERLRLRNDLELILNSVSLDQNYLSLSGNRTR